MLQDHLGAASALRCAAAVHHLSVLLRVCFQESTCTCLLLRYVLTLLLLLLLCVLSYSDDEEEVIAAAPEDPPDAAPWVTALKHGPYDNLDLGQRLAALLWLCGVVGEGLSARTLLDAREKEVIALKKQLQEDARVRTAAKGGARWIGGAFNITQAHATMLVWRIIVRVLLYLWPDA